MSDILAPLEPFRDRLVTLSGIDLVADAPARWSSTHHWGNAALLTAFLAPGNQRYRDAGGPSLDWLLGQTLGVDTMFDTLNFGVFARSGVGGLTAISFDASGSPLLPRTNLGRVFEYFGQIDSAAGAADVERLGASIEALPGSEVANDAVPARLNAALELIAAAFNHGLTRVVTLRLGHFSPSMRFTWLGHSPSTTWHEHAHYAGRDDVSRRALADIWRWCAEQLAGFARVLDMIPAGSGSLLDHTMIVWLSETGDTRSFGHTDIPIVILGGAGGALDTGQFLTVDRNHADLLLTLGQAAGLPITTFGNPAVHGNAAPIAELLR